MNRNAYIQQAATITFDVCIIGGGATGAGCALDAALRGLKVILVEKEDFSAATSSKSTKLIHGGVRYLEQAFKKLSPAQFKMVKKALKERRTLLHLAPHLTRPLALITPVKTKLAGLYYFIGLKLYDLLSGSESLGASKWLSRRQALQRIPSLKQNFAAAIMYYDGQLDDQRYGFALVQTACKYGAVAINHVQASGFEKDSFGKLVALQAQDTFTGSQLTIRAKAFINATGPFSDHIRLMANAALQPRMRVSKGVHIVLPRQLMPSNGEALLIPETSDGRLVFAIPYQHQLLIGTTEDETILTDQDFGPDKQEIEYILHYANQYLQGNIQPQQVKAGFGGLRPLVQASAGANTKELVRDHIVETDEQSKLISILGGKWTTYRLMAKDTIDVCEQQLSNKITAANTQHTILAGGENNPPDLYQEIQRTVNSWDKNIIEHLQQKYGGNALAIANIAAINTPLQQRLLPGLPYTFAQLQYVLENEMACTVKDVLNQRWGIALLSWQQTLQLIPIVGKVMKEYFNWNSNAQQLYIDHYTKEIEGFVKAADMQLQ